MLAPLSLFTRLRESFQTQPGGWWKSFTVLPSEHEFVVEDHRNKDQVHAIRVAWASVAAVCFVDGGQGSDCFYLFAADRTELAVVPVEASGGLAFWDALKARNLFPEQVSSQAVTSATQGTQLWWPPQHGR